MKHHPDALNKRSRYYIPVVLLLLLFAQLMYAGTHTSITLDEPLHMTSGFAHLTTGDYRLTEEHPPLMKALQAIPLLPLKDLLPDITSLHGWDLEHLAIAAQEFFVPFRPIDLAVIPARVPTMLMAIILGAFVYKWSKDVLGSREANLALVLFVFDPNILAHAALAATDLGAAWGIFVPMYMFWRWVRRTRLRLLDAVLAGVFLGFGLGMKLTVMTLGPIYAITVIVKAYTSKKWKQVFFHAGLIVLLAFLTLWAIYGFEFGPIPELPFPVPFPSHLLPIRRVLNHNTEGHAAFLLGQNYYYGDWRYFPVAFALKTPILTLSLLVFNLVYQATKSLRRRKLKSNEQPHSWSWWLLISLPVLYFAVSINSSINIGYRHLLPVLPFTFVICADAILNLLKLCKRLHVSRYVHKGVLVILLCLYAMTSLRLNPWHLAYFNAFAGGPENGYNYLVDSNTDWGQTWKALAAYQQEHKIANFNISAFTFNDPGAYGIVHTLLPPFKDADPVLPDRFEPAQGDYAISTTQLQSVIVAMPGMYDYFRHLEPDAKIGYALFVYHIPETSSAEWIAQCNHPVTALTEEMIVEGFRSEDARRISFDCTQTWLLPPGKGFTVIPAVSDSVTTHIDPNDVMRLAYEQTYSGWAPPFSIYERKSEEPWPQPEISAVSPEVELGGAFHYQGYTLETSEDSLTVYTYWQVLDMPQTPVSLMAHIHDEAGNTLGVADGLGAAHSELIPGSLVIQRHDFPEEAFPTETVLTLWVGAYSWPDLTRYEVTVDGESVGDVYNAGVLGVD